MLKQVLAGTFLLLAGCSQVPEERALTGYVEAEWAYLSAPASGWIRNLSVREGDSITPGDVLFRLDDDAQKLALEVASAQMREAEARKRDLQLGERPEAIDALKAQLAEAQAQRRLADSERRRWMTLVERGTASPAQGDQAREAWEVAEARVQSIEAQIHLAELGGREQLQLAAEAVAERAQAEQHDKERALREREVRYTRPARVEEILRHDGEWVTSGSPVLALLPDDALKVRFFVSQAELSQLTLGESVEVYTDGDASPVMARIDFMATEAEFTPPVIFSAATRAKLVFKVEAALPALSLRPGQPVDVRIP